jgi:plastocyanin domain-containing protein
VNLVAVLITGLFAGGVSCEAISGTSAVADPTTTTITGGHQEVVITATRAGYRPFVAAITAGIPTTLIVRSQGAAGCVRAFDIGGAETVLPESGDTRIDLGTPAPGTLRYACGMGMYTGAITIT